MTIRLDMVLEETKSPKWKRLVALEDKAPVPQFNLLTSVWEREGSPSEFVLTLEPRR